uniref:Uncharacterized protein n=1 Tax=Solanum tuberosum TaxID=4113 RepID=M1B9R7_SOLTU
MRSLYTLPVISEDLPQGRLGVQVDLVVSLKTHSYCICTGLVGGDVVIPASCQFYPVEVSHH